LFIEDGEDHARASGRIDAILDHASDRSARSSRDGRGQGDENARQRERG
jgi:hypothetical protein